MTTLKSDDFDPPEPAPGDRAYAVVRAAIGSVPVVGKAGVELLQYIVAPPLARRQNEWMNDIAAALRRPETRPGVSLDGLQENPAFIDAVLTATQIAIRTSQPAKLTALRNAVLNSALPSSPDVTRQQVFLSLVDRLTDVQLSILQLFHSPQSWASPRVACCRTRRRKPKSVA